jgi:hypothetical protein
MLTFFLAFAGHGGKSFGRSHSSREEYAHWYRREFGRFDCDLRNCFVVCCWNGAISILGRSNTHR